MTWSRCAARIEPPIGGGGAGWEGLGAPAWWSWAYWGQGCNLIMRDTQSAMNPRVGTGARLSRLKSQLGHFLTKSSNK